jgi:hypothetical protein
MGTLNLRPFFVEHFKRYVTKPRSWLALEKAIDAANNKKGCVDRRKLKRLCCEDEKVFQDVSLKMSELRAISRYLSRYGEGLDVKPFFLRDDNILQSLTQSKITIFVPANYDPHRDTETISRWDMDTAYLLQKALSVNSTEIQIQNVLIPSDDNPITSDMGKWEKCLQTKRHEDRKTTLISIGSPLSCAATEVLMAKNMEIQPYLGWGVKERPSLPFYFFFHDVKPEVCLSTFFVDEESACSLLEDNSKPEIKKMKNDDRAIIIGKRAYVANRVGTGYGILLARRHPSGQVLMSLSGTHGPLTLSLARVLEQQQIKEVLPQIESESIPQVLVVVVEATTKNRGKAGRRSFLQHKEERRFLEKQKIVFGPTFFSYSKGGWVEAKK